MAWVEERFLDQIAYASRMPGLWNAVRDNIGTAVHEFNNRVAAPEAVQHTDCMANGRFCVRVHRSRDAASVEVFLDEGDRSMKAQRSGSSSRTICKYRLAADRKEAELFVQHDGVQTVISVDDACMGAIGDFLFNPFPRLDRP